MSKEFNTLLKEIKSGDIKNIYALDGEEPYFIDLLCDAIEQYALQPHEKDFNFSLFYGKDTDVMNVITNCRKYPVFAARQLVMLKEAQTLKGLEELEPYIANSVESTILVIAHKYKKFDKRSKFYKTLNAKAICFTSEPIKDWNLADWISQHCKAKGLAISPQNAELLATNLGNDLQKIENEINKVLINAEGAKELTKEFITKFIGISVEYNAFELPNAVLDRDVLKTNKILNYFIANPKEGPMPLVLGSLYNKFSSLYMYHSVRNMPDKDVASLIKINPYFVKDFKRYAANYSLPTTENVLKLLYEYNLKSVGVDSTADNGSLLKELIAKIIYN